MALLGASMSILFPHTVTVVPIPQLRSMVGPPVGYSSSLGLASFLHPFSLCQSPPSLPFILSFVCPLCFHLLFFNFFSFFFFSPFLCFLLFHIYFFSALPVLLRHFSSYTSLPWFSTDRQHPPLNVSVTKSVNCSHILTLLVFSPVLQSTLLCSLVLLCTW